MSPKTTLSVDPAAPREYLPAALTSSTQYRMAPVTQKVANPTAMSSGMRQSSYAQPAHDGELRAANDPSLAIVRLMPKAKLSSFPLNHLPIAVVTATMSDSAPRPKISRPAAIVASVPDSAVTAAPARQMTPNASVARRVPMRSTMNPPMSTMTMFGML